MNENILRGKDALLWFWCGTQGDYHSSTGSGFMVAFGPLVAYSNLFFSHWIAVEGRMKVVP